MQQSMITLLQRVLRKIWRATFFQSQTAIRTRNLWAQSQLLAVEKPVGRYVTRQQKWLRKRVYNIVRPILTNLITPCTVVRSMQSDVALHDSERRTYFTISKYAQLLPIPSDTILLLTDDVNVIDGPLKFPNIRYS